MVVVLLQDRYLLTAYVDGWPTERWQTSEALRHDWPEQVLLSSPGVPPCELGGTVDRLQMPHMRGHTP